MKKILIATALAATMLSTPALASDVDLAKELQMLKAQLKIQSELINKLERRLCA